MIVLSGNNGFLKSEMQQKVIKRKYICLKKVDNICSFRKSEKKTMSSPTLKCKKLQQISPFISLQYIGFLQNSKD